MFESVAPRWPQEAFQQRNQAYEYQKREVERTISIFEKAPWRASTVNRAHAILETVAAKLSPENDIDIEALAKALREADLLSPAALQTPGVQSDADLLLGVVIGEVAALFLYQRTDCAAWAIISGLRFQFHGMHETLIAKVTLTFREDMAFRNRLKVVADTLVKDCIETPGSKLRGQEKENFDYVLAEWNKDPELREIWFGLRKMRTHYPHPNETDFLFDVYTNLDAKYAANLLDRFTNPYQIWMILTGFGGLRLSNDFAAWSELFKYSAPSFEADGSWNKNSLEPLLLLIAHDALSGALVPKDASSELIAARQVQFDLVTSAISGLITQKANGAALALRWG